MGDRYILEMSCPKCGFIDDEVPFAPTCGFVDWVSYEDASNADLIGDIVDEL